MVKTVLDELELCLEFAVTAVFEGQLDLYAGKIKREASSRNGLDDASPAPRANPRRVNMCVIKVEDRCEKGLELLSRSAGQIDDLFS